MNWKLIFQLSMFGLAMGIASVFFIPAPVSGVILGLFALAASKLLKRAPQT